MAMIIIGIILMVLGAGGLGYGIYLNNDTMARLESFLNSGNTNPGTIFMIGGGALLGVGLILLIVGIIVKASKKKSVPAVRYNPPVEIQSGTIEMPRNVVTCKKCGAENNANGKFCIKCGGNLNEVPEEKPQEKPQEDEENLIVCPHCGGILKRGNKFCQFCGKDIPDFL